MTYSFTVVLKETDLTDEQAQELYHECPDCTISIINGQVRIDFDREADTRKIAVDSANVQIRRVGLTPDHTED